MTTTRHKATAGTAASGDTAPPTKRRPRRVTRTRQHQHQRPYEDQDPSFMLDLVAALEAAWAAVRAHHPDLPEVVIIIGSGTTSRQAKWGHYGSLRWQHGDHRLTEVLISGEGLKRPAVEVFTTLLHEAAHALADARGIRDNSRQGRWHNARFAALAGELGLQPHQDDRIGWSPCTLPNTTQTLYAAQLASLAQALTAYRHPELHLHNGTTGTTGATPGTTPGTGRRGSNNGIACACSCPRRIRVAPTVLNEGTITCDICGNYFEPQPSNGSNG